MQAAACAIVISFRTEPGHIVQHLWSTVAKVCHGGQGLGEPEKSDLPSAHTHTPLFAVILDSLVFPMVTMFLHLWVPTETCWVSAKKPFPALHQEESGNLGIFSQVENLGKDADSYSKSIR